MFVLICIVIAIVVYCKRRNNAILDAREDEIAYRHGCSDYEEYLDRYEDRECCEEDY